MAALSPAFFSLLVAVDFLSFLDVNLIDTTASYLCRWCHVSHALCDVLTSAVGLVRQTAQYNFSYVYDDH